MQRHAAAAGLVSPPTAVFVADVSAFGNKDGGAPRENLRWDLGVPELGDPCPRLGFLARLDYPRRRSFFTAAAGKCSNQVTTGTPMPPCGFTEQEFHSAAQSAPGLKKSRLASISGRLIMGNANCQTSRVGAYGYSLGTATGV